MFPLTVYIIALNSGAINIQNTLKYSAKIVDIVHLILVLYRDIIGIMGKETFIMAIQYKIDILAALKEKGYTSTRIREEKLIGQSYLQQIRHGELVSWKTIDTICRLLNCQPGDLVEYISLSQE